MSLENKNLINLCHFCLKQTKKLKSIFDETQAVTDNLVDFISLITNFKVGFIHTSAKGFCFVRKFNKNIILLVSRFKMRMNFRNKSAAHATNKSTI